MLSPVRRCTHTQQHKPQVTCEEKNNLNSNTAASLWLQKVREKRLKIPGREERGLEDPDEEGQVKPLKGEVQPATPNHRPGVDPGPGQGRGLNGRRLQRSRLRKAGILGEKHR